ncbi:MAG: oligosaccharide flippase family protein [Ignavibacteriae bacterium]|nr:oligosaccharide flippase family protein [Ignavibacteriota bacterium]
MNSESKNSIWLSIQYIVTLISSLIMLKLNITHFGSEIFGIWLLFASIWGTGSAIDFGFGTAIIKFTAQLKSDERKLNGLLSSSFYLFLTLGIILLVLINLIGHIFIISEVVRSVGNNNSELINIFTLLGFSFLIQYVSIFLKSIFEGMNDFKLVSKITIFQSLTTLLFVTIIYIFNLSIIWLAIGYLSTWFIILLVYIYYLKNIHKSIKIKLSFFDLNNLKGIVGFSVSIQFTSIFTALIDPVIKFLIGNYLGTSHISFYEIARRFAQAMSGLFFNTFRIILPKASILNTTDEKLNFLRTDGKKFSKLGITYSGTAFGLFLAPLTILIKLLFGIDEPIIIFLILALPESVNSFGYTIYIFLIGIGKAHFIALVQLTNVLLISSSLFIGFYIYNTVLGLFGYFITVVLVNIGMFLFVQKLTKIDLKEFISSTKVFKLVFLVSCIIISTFLIYFKFVPFYVPTISISFIMSFVFYNDIKLYINFFLNKTEVEV